MTKPKRVRLSRSTWQSLVADWRKSGVSAPEFAARRGIELRQLRWWAWRLRAPSEVATDASARERRAPASQAMAFVELAVAREERVELVFGAGRTLRFSASIDPTQLSRIVEAIEVSR